MKDMDRPGDAAIAASQSLKEKEYWLKQLSGELQKTGFPYDLDKPSQNKYLLKAEEFEFSQDLFSRLMRLSNRSDARLHMIMTAGLVVLLDKYTGNRDIIVGTLIYKQEIEAEFINTLLALRIQLDDTMVFKELLLRVRETIVQAVENQNYPFESLLNQLNLEFSRDRDDIPLFDAAILVENVHNKQYLRHIKINTIFSFLRTDRRIRGKLEYNSLLYEKETIKRIIIGFTRVLEKALSNLDLPLRDLDILSSIEKEKLLYDFNQTAAEYPRDKLIHELFAETAENSPNHTAVVWEDKHITYNRLHQQSRQLAGVLQEKGVLADDIVGIMMERSIGMIIGILGILKAGGAYLPLDPDYPEERIKYILTDAMVNILVIDSNNFRDPFIEKALDTISLDDVSKYSSSPKALKNSPQGTSLFGIWDLEFGISPRQGGQLAYVIYTSGTTGRPKGVLIRHCGLVNYIWWAVRTYTRNRPVNFPLYTSIAFDLTVTSIYTPLITGNAVVIYGKDEGRLLIEKIIEENKVEVVKLTPSHLKLIKQRRPNRQMKSAIQCFIVGGEQLDMQLAAETVQIFNGDIEIFNEYGPTETVVGSMIYRFNPGKDRGKAVPIGVPIANAGIYLLDRNQAPVPVGAAAEIYISGEGVCRGYLNQPELTSEKFDHDLWDYRGYHDEEVPFGQIKNAFGENKKKNKKDKKVPGKIYHPGKSFCGGSRGAVFSKSAPLAAGGQRIYRTGDFARWLADGNIEFLGRMDQQVKIRGFRIELAEIENKLKKYQETRLETILHDDAANIINHSKNAVFCRRCLLSSHYPGIHFDKQGICSSCREYDRSREQLKKYFKKKEDFLKLVDQAREENPGEYDCLLLFSGGKDSSYVLYQLVGMGLKVLTFTFDNGFISDTAFANIERITKELRVENIVARSPRMNKVFVESLRANHNVCHGCWHALNTFGIQAVQEKNINMIVSGLSKGQIFDMRLRGLFQMGTVDQEEIEEKLLLFRKSFHSTSNRFSRLLKTQIQEKVMEKIYFVDFFRYFDTPVREIKTYLLKQGWQQPGDTGFCSSNCMINDVGIYMHLREKGYHFYSDSLSWDCRLDTISREEGLDEIDFHVDPVQVHRVLKQIGYYCSSPVEDAVVVDREDKNRNKYLCAYYVSPDEIQAADLRDYLLKELPGYMVPSYFIPVDMIPLTANGKLDRRSLPAPAIKAGDKYAAPETGLEKRLAAIWEEILGTPGEVIGINTSFFELGGHSLSATILVSRIHKEFAVTISLGEFFKKPTITGLSRYITRAAADTYTGIEPVEEKEYYPLSSTQKRLYILQQIATRESPYNMPHLVFLEKNTDKEKLERVFKALIARHESLRTSFEMVGDEPIQRIHQQVDFSIQCVEIDDSETEEDIIQRFFQPFVLTQPPLLRVHLLTTGSKRQVLFIDMHHIITDAASLDILEGDFLACYRGEDLAPLRLRYKDFSEQQNSIRRREAAARQEAYWLKIFSPDEELPVIHLPIDYPRPLLQSFAGNTVAFVLDAEETAIVKQVVRENDLTLYMCLLAVFNLLLSKLGSQEDIIVGTPMAARRSADLQGILGMLVNTLALRNYPSANKTIKEFLKEIKQHTLDAFENQEFPFEELVEKITVNRDSSRNPLFDVMFNMMNSPGDFDQTNFPGLEELISQSSTSDSYTHRKATSRFDLVFSATDLGTYIHFMVEYCTRLFKPRTIDRFIHYFKNIVRCLPGNTTSRLSDITILSEEEKRKILEISSGAREIYDIEQSIHRWFEQQVEQTPDHVALSGQIPNPKFQIPNKVESFGQISDAFGGEHLSYGELNKKSNRLAHLLIEKGVRADMIVGMMLERSLEMIIAILGILKAGGAYLPIDPGYPWQRIRGMLDDSGAVLLVTQQPVLAHFSITALKNMKSSGSEKDLVVTPVQRQILDFDSIPIPDRTLIDYKKYHQYIGEAPAKHTITLQATRGCPYNCLYCHKIWPKKHVARSAENIYKEISYVYDAGVRRFVFIDDIFNLEHKNAARFLEMIIKSKKDLRLFFPNGFRGDILTRDFIDLMVQAGTVNLDVALESASPRIQRLIKKNLNLEKFKENVQYITEKYPQVILEMEMMHGFPTETEEEAIMTLDFLKSLKWVHFPNLHVLKIFPNTDICRLAIENGISPEAIERSAALAFHELPDTLPFPKSFTRQFQSRFMGEYFLAKERLLHVLPLQMKILTEDELVQKYDSYLSAEVKKFDDILDYAGISRQELGDVKLMQAQQYQAPDFVQKISQYFPVKTKTAPASVSRILLLDLSQLFSEEHETMLHHQIEEPLGLLYLMTYLNETFKDRIQGKIFKSRIDFDSYTQLKQVIDDFKPDIIGIRTLSFYKEFFHKTVLMIRQWGVQVPIIAGGPYATSDYQLILQDSNVDIVVLGEGELTLAQLVEQIIKNNKKLPGKDVLREIRGIAFAKDKLTKPHKSREILLVDEIMGRLDQYPRQNPGYVNQARDLLYVIYTSGSTGKPKGVMLEQGNLVNLIRYQYNQTNIDFSRVLQFTTITFDVSAQEIFSTLLVGGQLSLVDREALTDIPGLMKRVETDRVKTLFLPASFLKFLMNEEDFLSLVPAGIDHIVTAGEQVVINERFKRYLKENRVYFHNHYGPSETHVVTALTMKPAEDIPELPPIGRPVTNTAVYILDKGMNPVPIGVSAELFIGGIQVGRGYLNNPGLTSERFINYKLQNTNYKQITNHNVQNYNENEKVPGKKSYVCLEGTRGLAPLPKKDQDKDQMQSCNHVAIQPCSHAAMPSLHHPIPPLPHSPIYRTGDLARCLPDGNLEFLGRMDFQVKIRGFRVELGEIERQLLNHEKIKACVVSAIPAEKGSKNLCAYIVSTGELTRAELREYLALELPDYMIPSYFVFMEHIPLTAHGKIDRRMLPEPGIEPGAEARIAPRDAIEETLVRIWADILALEKENISIDANFFQLGGHSLRATIMTSKIHEAFNVKIPLAQVFKTPDIKELSRYISGLTKDKYTRIEPVEKKEYYVLSPAQQRLYILQQMDPDSTAYNMLGVIPITGEADMEKLAKIFQQLIKRHESLRTSFLIAAEEPVQKVHDQVEFEIENYQVEVKVEEERSSRFEGTGGLAPLSVELAERKAQSAVRKEERYAPCTVRYASTIKNFIRPFDLSRAPLLQVGLIEKPDHSYLLLVDMHHIISDGISSRILAEDFTALYRNEELPTPRLQYKDYSQWQNKPAEKKRLKAQEIFWLKEFNDEIPRMNLPFDYPEPGNISPAGNSLTFALDKEETRALKEIGRQAGATLYMVLLALYNILLSRLCSQEEIVVGTPMAGRGHADLQDIIGFFINMLPLRNFPGAEKSLDQFLAEVKQRALQAFENQDYPLQELVAHLPLKRENRQNPLFNVGFGLFHTGSRTGANPPRNLYQSDEESYRWENNISKIDISLHCFQQDDDLSLVFQYSTHLFKEETIRRFASYFKEMVTAVTSGQTGNRELALKIKDIRIIPPEEKRRLLYDFSHQPGSNPIDKTIHALFEEQVQKTPDHTALRSFIDFNALDETPGDTAAYLEKYQGCCFKKNPYLFQYNTRDFLKSENIQGIDQSERQELIVLKTHRQNYVAVNPLLFSLLDYFKPGINLKSIIKGFSNKKNRFLLFNANHGAAGDALVFKRYIYEITPSLHQVIPLLKTLVMVDLLEPAGCCLSTVPLAISLANRLKPNPDKKEKDTNMKLAGKSEIAGENPGETVLLLGDTPGTATTGLLYLAAYLRRNGIKAYCQWNDPCRTLKKLKENIKKLLTLLRPGIVGISMKWFPHLARVVEISKIIKTEHPSVKVIVGGNTASYFREKVIREKWIDAVIIGDGEVPLLRICRGETEVSNVIYKQKQKVVRRPIGYIQHQQNSKDIFLSHLEEMVIPAEDLYLAPDFYINTGKGCSQQCIYCAGCREAQQQVFNRSHPFLRGVREVRKDITAVLPYASTLMFDFDLPLYDANCFDYYRQIWEGIDLSKHFCRFYFWKLPSPGFIQLVSQTFKYVYLNIDLCSLSENHRLKLQGLGLVKPQPTDRELLAFFTGCERYENVEVKINQVAGLPYFTSRDMKRSDDMLTRIIDCSTRFTGIDWGRLHAQPGAPITLTSEKYDMHSYATTYEDFYHYSMRNLVENTYPGLENLHYPYIYFNDDDLNSRVSKFYFETEKRLTQIQRDRKNRLVFTHDITFENLNRQANGVAQQLRNRGVQADTIVAIAVKPSTTMAIGILGILKAGGAYLPIDPGYPEARIKYMLADAKVNILVKNSNKFRNLFVELGLDTISLDDISLHSSSPEALNNSPQGTSSFGIWDLEFGISPQQGGQLAYIIYTSGTTGQPKGVLNQHHSAVNTLLYRKKEYQMSCEDVAVQLFSFTFDGFVTSFFTPLISGSQVILMGEPQVKDITYIKDVIVKYRVTHFICVPPLYRVIIENLSRSEASSLKVITLAGEKVTSKVLEMTRQKNRNLEIVNEYGVTEAAVISTIYRHQQRDPRIKIGGPIENTCIYILNGYFQLQPMGIAGELCLSGAGLARGYLNNPELTAEKFCLRRPGWVRRTPAPPGPRCKNFLLNLSYLSYMSHIYKTGDLARWLPDGNIEFMGRIDHQVKIRGFRIELREIENRLLKYPGIKETVVTAREDKGEDKYLCAYFVVNTGPGVEELKEYLSQSLPDYMIPVYFVQVDEFPLTSTGKLDRSALPAPGAARECPGSLALPQNPIQEKLVEIWTKVLGLENSPIGIDDNFFALGGHSLKATNVISRIQKEFNVTAPLVEVFKSPTIRSLSQYIHDNNDHWENFAGYESNDRLTLLKPGNRKVKHLFLLHDGTGGVEAYIELCKGLTAPFNYWGIHTRQFEYQVPRDITIEEIAGKYLENIKMIQPQGPYFMSGWSLGGTIAFEIACQLERVGEKISFLGLIDAPGPGSQWQHDIKPFSLETEKDLFMPYFPGNDIKEKLKNAANIHEIWEIIANYLDADPAYLEKIKGLIPGQLAQFIPNYQQLDIKECITYLNTTRTLTNARAFYIPSGKITGPVHYFQAKESPTIYKHRWRDYATRAITSHYLPGDHFSIFNPANIAGTAKIFSHVISRIKINPGDKQK